MASARQKEIKVAHLEKQVERLDGRIQKAKRAVDVAQGVVLTLAEQREKLIERLQWQKNEPVTEGADA